MPTSSAPSDPHSDAGIVESWHRNAAPWIRAVRARQIESRRLVTDQAVIDAILSRAPGTAIDIGCGEGWLTRALASRGIRTLGVDVVPELIEQARAAGEGEFRAMSYAELARGGLGARWDIAVCNFSLLGQESVEQVFAALPSLVEPNGSVVVQTLHPLIACGDAPYLDGWRDGSWDGCGEEFTDPAPWYFRTLESWGRLFTARGLRLLEVREPLHPANSRPVSVLFVAQR
ncbi:MAG: methyltransferase domain-containing protein [Acidihalobacter sp.]